jgi:hypothetical protein
MIVKNGLNIMEAIMSKFLPIMSILIIAAAFVYSQTPVIEWETVIGAVNNDKPTNIFQTADGGYIVGGTTHSFGGRNQDNFYIKLNADGDTVWTKAYGDYTHAESVSEFIRTSDGGYIIVGNKARSPYPSLFFMLKLDENCDSVWAVISGDPDCQKGAGGIAEAYDNGYVFTGQCSQDNVGPQIAIIKTSTDGAILWEKYYGLAGTDMGYSIIRSDGGYMITGVSPSFNNQQFNSDLFLMKTDADGDTVWTKSYGGEQEERGSRIRKTADGGYVAVGYSKSFGGGYTKDWYIVRTNADGDSLWTRVYGSPYEDVALDIKELPDNAGFVVAGGMHYGQWDGCLLRLDANGDSLWAIAIGGEDYEIFYAVELTDDGGYILAGQTESYGAGGHDIYIVKLSPEQVGIDNQNAPVPRTFSLSQNYPNPFNTSTVIEYQLPTQSQVKIEIYNILGNRLCTIQDRRQSAGYYRAIWNADGFSSGIYFYKIQAGAYIETEKMLLIK